MKNSRITLSRPFKRRLRTISAFSSSRIAFRNVVGSLLVLVLVAGCATTGGAGGGYNGGSGGTNAGIKPHYKVGNPYQIGNEWYYPAADDKYREIGVASWYGPNFHGKPTANGELFDRNAMTAAHRTLPMPSIVEVKNLDNGRKIRVRVNDRGPFAKDRIIDLSEEAARRLGFVEKGTARVEVRYLREATLDLALVRLNDRRGMRALEKEFDRGARLRLRNGDRRARLRTGEARRREDLTGLIAETVLFQPSANIDGVAPISPYLNSPGPIPPVNKNAGTRAIIPERASADYGASRGIVQERFEIQVGAFSDLNRAELLRQHLSQSGPVFLQSVNLPSGGATYKVIMGPYLERNIADNQLGALHGAGYRDAWIIQTTSW